MFSAKNSYKTTGLGVVIVGKGQAGLTCGQDDPPVLIDTNSRLCGRGHLDGENGISERKVLGKSCSHYGDSLRRETFSVDFTV